MSPVQDVEGFRLSPQQRHLWRLGAGEPSSPFRTQGIVSLTGNPDVAVVAAAFEAVAARHEALRTTFPLLPGISLPLQAVGAAGAAESGVVTTIAEPELALLADEEWEAPLDPLRAPWRWRLAKVEGRGTVLVLTLSALLADDVGLALVAEEVLRACGPAGAAGADEPVQLIDVADWQNEVLESAEAAAGRDFWRRLPLADALAVDLPLARRGGEAPFLPSSRRGRLEASVTARLADLASECGCAPAAVVLAAWRTVLWRAADRRSAAVAVHCSGRRHGELATALGPLGRHVPLVADVAADRSFAEVVRETVAALGEVERWQDCFDWSAVGGRTDGEPFAPFAFSAAPQVANGLRRRGWVGDRWVARLATEEQDGTRDLELHFDAGALSASDADRLVEETVATLREAVAAPRVAVGRVEGVGADERRFLAEDLNPPATVPGPVRRLSELFEQQADRTPDAVAIRCGDRSVSYGELERQANRLAWRLRGLGVGPGQPVALCAERGIETVVAVLAVLKADGAFLPIEPDYPAVRIAQAVEDARPVTWVAVGDAAVPLDGAGVRLPQEQDSLLAESAERPVPRAAGEDLAYALFTSGSTGRPKGVAVPHRAIVRHLEWMARRLPLGPGDHVLHRTPLSFDPSVWELFAPLQAGATIEIARPGGHRDTDYLLRLVAEREVTVLRLVPTLLRLLTEEPGLTACTALREVCCGGEVLRPELAAAFAARHPARLNNLYGPTETAVAVTAWAYGEAGGAEVPIGVPAAGCRIHLLRSDLVPVPFGAAGELWVGGEAVARGYLSRPAQTAERFRPDPFSAVPGGRLYRTGDLARHRREGELLFLGRVDHQVKLRGYRVELGEVETALREQPEVAAAVCAVREVEPGLPLLVGYWVAAAGCEEAANVLEERLRERLALYMVPGAMVRLEALPLAPNGKVDRQALPLPASRTSSSRYVMPSNPEEEILAAIWSEVLRIERVGVQDNFFSLGADSIRALRVLALAKERGLEVPLTALFQHQTIAELVVELRRLSAPREEEAESVPFSLLTDADRAKVPPGVTDVYPMTSMQVGMLYHMHLNPDAAYYHNVNSFLFKARFSEEHLREAVRRQVARHPVLRTSFDFETFSEPMQLVHAQAELPVEVEDLRGMPREEQARVIDSLVERERQRLFDLGRPPQMRYFVHRVEDDSFWFTQVDNHAIVDGWSLTSILREILTVHNALLYGRTVPEEPPLRCSFRDFVRLEREALGSVEHQRYWRQKVEGGRPSKLPRPAIPPEPGDAPAGLLPVELGDEVLDGLRELARSTAVPIKSVCLAAHLKALHLMTGEDDLITGLPTHGRPEHVDGERVRGLFLNTVPFRLRLGEESWRQLAERVFGLEREFLPYRRYPLSAILRNGNRDGLFETLFSFVEFHHAYALMEEGEVQLLEDYKAWAFPHYTLMCGFNQHPPAGRLSLRLYYDRRALSVEQVQFYGDCYRRVLEAMAGEPDGRHTGLDAFIQPAQEAVELLRRSTEVPELREGFSF